MGNYTPERGKHDMSNYTPENGIEFLYTDFVSTEPIYIDWSEHWVDEYTAYAAERCERCGRIVVNIGGEEEHRYLGHLNGFGEDEDEGDEDEEIPEPENCTGVIGEAYPTMYYGYPIDVDRVGGIEEAARLIYDLPLCVVEMEHSGDTYLALTGGGMDMSWEICEAYMRLGYLPPVHFARLPQYAGLTLNARTKWIIDGMKQSIDIRDHWLSLDREHLNHLMKTMKTMDRAKE